MDTKNKDNKEIFKQAGRGLSYQTFFYNNHHITN